MQKCKYLGVVTGKEHQDNYNQMVEEGCRIYASTILPIKATDDEENTALFHVWYYYEEPAKKEIKKEAIKLEL